MSKYILAIDPSLNSTGYAVVDTSNNEVIALGKIAPQKNSLESEKLYYIHQQLYSILDKYRPNSVVCEDQFYSRNSKTLMILSHVRGVIMCLAAQFGAHFVLYAPSEVKKAITGSGKANKQDIYTKVRNVYQDTPSEEIVLQYLKKPKVTSSGKNKNDDISDALAIALAHMSLQHGRLS